MACNGSFCTVTLFAQRPSMVLIGDLSVRIQV
jgi:hypothetical protein